MERHVIVGRAVGTLELLSIFLWTSGWYEVMPTVMTLLAEHEKLIHGILRALEGLAHMWGAPGH